MKKNLNTKIAIILGILLVFTYGIFFGFDAPKYFVEVEPAVQPDRCPG